MGASQKSEKKMGSLARLLNNYPVHTNWESVYSSTDYVALQKNRNKKRKQSIQNFYSLICFLLWSLGYFDHVYTRGTENYDLEQSHLQ